MVWKYTLIVFTLAFVLIAAWLPFNGDIHYFSDNARDLLLLNEIATEKPITLIGPRSGISGVFHGPLWLYLNLPAFLLGGGNPVVLGWFWWGLFLINIGIVFVVAQKLFGSKERPGGKQAPSGNWQAGLVAALKSGIAGISVGIKSGLAGLVASALFSVTFFATGWSQFNANGVLLVMPVLFYVLLKHLASRSVWAAVAVFFLIGLLIQFQIAFGLPMLILIGGLFCVSVVSSGRLSHLPAMLALLPGISTHILFDARHDFIQLKSLLGYAGKAHGGSFWQHALSRGSTALQEVAGWLPRWLADWLSGWLPDADMWLSIGLIFLLLYAFTRTQSQTLKRAILLYAYLYVGFWVVTLGYRGTMWPYYHWGLLPCFMIVLAGVVTSLSGRLKTAALACICVIVGITALHWIVAERPYALAPRPISWKFHKEAVEKIYRDAPREFGYYVFEDDLFGYGPKYAFEYVGRHNAESRAELNRKHTVTVLYMMPTNSAELSWEGWIRDTVRLSARAHQTTLYPNGVGVYWYTLAEEDMAVPSDPNLLDSLIFR